MVLAMVDSLALSLSLSYHDFLACWFFPLSLHKLDCRLCTIYDAGMYRHW
jgi:hypothetical protein